jgi:hypothetical protein
VASRNVPEKEKRRAPSRQTVTAAGVSRERVSTDDDGDDDDDDDTQFFNESEDCVCWLTWRKKCGCGRSYEW